MARSKRHFFVTQTRRQKSASDVKNVPALIPKGRVLGEKVANNFFSDCISDQKILMAFFTKTFRLIARPEFNFRSPKNEKNEKKMNES